MRTSNERRNFRKKAICHGIKLQKDLGTRGGLVYEKHIDKIENQPGRYAKGSISHYVQTKPHIKSRGKNMKYADRHTSSRISIQEQKEIDRLTEEETMYIKGVDNN